VDNNTPTSLFYQCALHPNMGGNITVVHTPPPNPGNANNQTGAVIGLAIAFVIVALIAIFLIIYIIRKVSGGTAHT